MIPDTKNGLNAMACVSAMQKSIRRGMEREAMEFASNSCTAAKPSTRWSVTASKSFAMKTSTRWPRRTSSFVAASLAASRERYSKSIGEARLMVGNAIRMMCRSPKSRAGCHFAAAIGLRSKLEDFAPEYPDYALDMHTLKGKAMGRGLDHFREEGARLVPPPTGDDPYEDEAYRLWQIKQRSK
jgi:hypothetical protein